MIIKTDYQRVRELARDVGVLSKVMILLCQGLNCDLEELKKTFSDDGIEAVDRCVKDIFDAFGQCQNDMVELVKNLLDYAAGLEKTK